MTRWGIGQHDVWMFGWTDGRVDEHKQRCYVCNVLSLHPVGMVVSLMSIGIDLGI